jgi:ATP adenylyltransferase
MEQPLWAPWRMEYIRGGPAKGCIFCDIPAAPEAEDRKNLVVHRTANCFVILNRFPYNAGHLLVVPRRHAADIGALPDGEWADLQDLLRRSAAALRHAYQPQGINLGMNLGQAAGAGIADHLHWHLVPRWLGDNNFMPLFAETRVIVDHLDTTWEKVRAGFAAIGG